MISRNLSHQAYRMLPFWCFSVQRSLPDFKGNFPFTDRLCSKSVCEQSLTWNNFPVEHALLIYVVITQDGPEDKT